LAEGALPSRLVSPDVFEWSARRAEHDAVTPGTGLLPELSDQGIERRLLPYDDRTCGRREHGLGTDVAMLVSH
jgi:hypothetical protein